jgi:NAD(P)-dependent dehydrogenase (short-subunit alcohol dehydrogenase family)
MPRPAKSPRESPARAFERKHAGCWPVGHLAGWRGPSGFSSRSTAREVVRESGKSLRGRVAVVTGANCGVGFETARALALGGAEAVILACRDPVTGAEAARAIRDEARALAAASMNDASTPASPDFHEKEKKPSCRVECLNVDLESFASVRAFADAFRDLNLPLHILVHNAGVMPAPWQETSDGHERTMQVNVLGPVLLTRLLFPFLRGERFAEKETTSHVFSRVVFVTSAAHYFSYNEGVRLCPKTDTHVTSCEKHDPIKAYAESKLCLIFLARLLAKTCEASRRPDQKKVCFFAAHPGAVLSKGGERARKQCGGFRGAVLHFIGRPFVKSTEAGAATSALCCVFSDEEASEKNGAYFVNCEARAASKKAESDVAAMRATCRFVVKTTSAFPETRNDAFATQLTEGAYGE